MHCHVAEGLAFALDVRNVVEKVFYLSSFVFRFLTSLEKKTAILSNFIYILFIYLSVTELCLVSGAEKYCVLVSHSSPYDLPACQSESYAGLVTDELARLLAEVRFFTFSLLMCLFDVRSTRGESTFL